MENLNKNISQNNVIYRGRSFSETEGASLIIYTLSLFSLILEIGLYALKDNNDRVKMNLSVKEEEITGRTRDLSRILL
jgi:hypothetical protein